MPASENKACQNCKESFLINAQDFDFYKKINVPPPTFCPDCRFQRRLMFRNERNLYKRECDLCKKQILSTYSPEKPHTVYCPPCWWSDAWDPLEYGREYEPNRPFFDQVDELWHNIPLVALGTNHPTLTNSEYVNESGFSKNCYLIFDADYCENVLYSTRLSNVKDAMDLHVVGESELCYEDVNCRKSSRLFFSEDSSDCVDVLFSKNCWGCTNCFGCANLRNKSYYIWNKPCSKDEYAREMRSLREEMKTREGIERLRKKAEDVWLSVPHKFMHGFQNVNVSGDYVYESKNARDSFQARGLEDVRFCQFIKDERVKDAYDYTIWGDNAELIYECCNVGAGVYNVRFSYVCALGHTMNLEYCFWCIESTDLFGCSAIRKKKYCILNKQYSESDFHALRSRIVEDMNTNPYIDDRGRIWKYGEYFPYNLSPYCYNETDAQTHCPMKREDANRFGWEWKDSTLSEHVITLKGADLPKTSEKIGEDIFKEVIGCAVCGRAYRFVPAEVGFLNRFDLPLPEKCFECRYKRRFARLNPLRLWTRTCRCGGVSSERGAYANATSHAHGSEHCSNTFQTSYAPGRPEIVYCEACYQAEVA
ncbi:MAG: hypothetical protein AAB495_00240 [Patescibacteria group bacterium]